MVQIEVKVRAARTETAKEVELSYEVLPQLESITPVLSLRNNFELTKHHSFFLKICFFIVDHCD